MRHYKLSIPAVAILMLIAWSSCVKEQCMRTYTYFEPVYRTTQEVRANIRSNEPRAVAHPGKIYISGRYIFLNELDRGIHIIDNSVPAAPRRVAFIDIPGCVDMAVKGNTLYADAYTDLVVLDISNPLQASLKKIVEHVFPYRYYGSGFVADSSRVVVDWIERDTTVQMECNGGLFGTTLMQKAVVMENIGCMNCGFRGAMASSSGQTPFGMGGSMARFAIMGNHLYTVSNADLQVFGIANPESPVRGRQIPLAWNIETVYPFRDRLFIGSNAGMYLFSVANPDVPVQIGKFEHARACDPVVGDDRYAYITLRSGTACEGFNNQLDIVDIADPSKASLLKTYAMQNPHGLSKDGNLLFICDGAAGLKVYDATDLQNLKLLSVVEGIETYDVITWQGIALVTAKGGIYQYEYSNPAKLKLVSKMEVPY